MCFIGHLCDLLRRDYKDDEDTEFWERIVVVVVV